jgi:uncharacterized protein YcbK (DUF882 family)
MKHRSVSRGERSSRLAQAFAAVATLTVAALATSQYGYAAPTASTVAPAVAEAAADKVSLLDGFAPESLFGKSGRLRMRVVGSPRRTMTIPILERLFGDSAVQNPGIYTVDDSTVGRPFSFITLVPFEQKRAGRLGEYRLGSWPSERRRVRADSYLAPEGFIEVTMANQDHQVSDHFRLRDFLTHDQQTVWPKYLVLRETLVDKLELVITELERSGFPVEHMVVMSGFRTPQYNARGVGKGGRAQDSRHQFGDAADVFVDNDRNGRMDDLNRDGRVNSKDAAFLAKIVERVETNHPEFVGGVGIYRATSAHGPFVHVDTRGVRARWGRA